MPSSLPVLVDVDRATVRDLPCCGVKDASHEGRCYKIRWLEEHFKLGLRAKVLLTPDRRQCGYIEYLPGEFAWRGIDARGYLVIHCIWTFYKQYQHRGFGARMVQACIDDATQGGMYGVAVVARHSPWLASPSLFLANGFECVATAPPDYQLLVRKTLPSAPDPAFRPAGEDALAKYRRGLTIVTAGQCPHVARFAREIAECAEQEFDLKPRIVSLRSHTDAQNAPTPYAVFALIYKGRILADHQISRTRFRKIMNHLPE